MTYRGPICVSAGSSDTAAAPQLSHETTVLLAVTSSINIQSKIQARIGMPGSPITVRLYEDYMKLRDQHAQDMAAAKAGFSQSTASLLDRNRDQLLRKIGNSAMLAVSLILRLTSGFRR